MRRMKLWLGAMVLVGASGLSAQSRVYVNGEHVSQEQFAQELRRYGIPMQVQVPDGRYWYDARSGLWGVEGGPTAGLLPPSLRLGGELQADVSGSGTGVFMNGREIHPLEYAYLHQIFGYVLPGRFWLDAQGNGGLEGGPPMFNLVAAAQQAGVGGGGNNSTRRGPFGATGSDGNCSYFMHPNGSSVMSGRC